MEGPRCPAESELPRVIEFLNSRLREGANWSISSEYPTALTSSNLHNMRIITADDVVVSHAVIKPLVVKSPHVIFKVAAIGSVVTDPEHRNQGHSSTVIRDCIDQGMKQHCDLAVLWTNMFDFYRRFGFELAGSEVSLIIEGALEVPAGTLRFSDEKRVSPEALQRLYLGHSVGSVRTSEDIRKFLAIPQTRLYTAWEADGTLAAFAVEGKGADLSGYIHEWAGGVSKLLALIAWVKSRRSESLTLIAPRHSRNLISQLQGLGATTNEGYLGMVKILNFEQLSTKIKRAFRAEGVSDIVLEKQGEDYVFGIGTELFTLDQEDDVCRLLFGPVNMDSLDMISAAARAKLAKLLPLPLWLWGWDSV